MGRRIRLTRSSLMRDTVLFQLRDPDDNSRLTNRYAWGTWEPIEIPPDPTDEIYVVKEPDLGRLDSVAYRLRGTPHLFPLLADLNGILDQFTDDPSKGGMYVGQRIRIPRLERIQAFLFRGKRTSTTSQTASVLDVPRDAL